MQEPIGPQTPSSTRARWLLGLGALAGLGLALASMLTLEGAGDDLPDFAVARVNHAFIGTEEFGRAIAALEQERREPLEAEMRRRILDRLIDEELLVQHGLEIGLARNDRQVRGDLVSAVIDTQVAAAALEPSESELRDFFSTHRDLFATAGRLRVARLWIKAEPERSREQAQARGAEALARVRAGEAFARVKAELGDAELVTVPNAPLPPAKLREYLGPTLTDAAISLTAGEASEPVELPDGFHVLYLAESSAGHEPTFEEAREQVRAEFVRNAADRGLREKLTLLRRDGRIEIREPLP